MNLLIEGKSGLPDSFTLLPAASDQGTSWGTDPFVFFSVKESPIGFMAGDPLSGLISRASFLPSSRDPGTQAPPIQVGTPILGNTQICRAIHPRNRPSMTRISMFILRSG